MRLRSLRIAFVVLALVASVVAASARAGSGLVIGVDDDTLKWTDDTASIVNTQRDLGAVADRVTLQWQPGETTADPTEQTYLRRAQAAAKLGQRVVLAIFGPATSPPTTQPEQDGFCAFAVDALSRARSIRDIVIWNEANSAVFWKPQQGAAAAYEGLLADCYDKLHSFSKTVNVISSTSPHENPAAFIQQLGATYRASGRTLPIFDTFGHDAYPEVSSESPLATHATGLSLDEGDYVRLLADLQAAFGGTGQPVPGDGNVPSGGFLTPGAQMSSRTGIVAGANTGGPVTIWYLEDGFETVIPPALRSVYTGHETNHQLVQPVAGPAKPGAVFVPPNQAGQLRDALELAYCQPAVSAFFNFELEDEVDLGGWQSGLIYANGQPKPSYAVFKAEIAAVSAGQVDCSRFSSALTGVAPGAAAAAAAPATAAPSP